MRICFVNSKMSNVAFLFLAFLLICIVPLKLYAASADSNSLNYLTSFQDGSTGGVKEESNDTPQSLQTDWAIIAFSSSGFDGNTIGAPKNMIDFALSDACDIKSLTDIERRIIALQANKIDTHKLEKCNLPQVVTDAISPSGQIGSDLVSTVFGAIALSSADDLVPQKTIDYIIYRQSSDGGWDSGYGTESNLTAQAIMALVSSKTDINKQVFNNAKSYLKNLQSETGGVKYDANFWSTESDAFSDSFTLQAIYSLNEDPLDAYWLRNGKSIIDDLETLKNTDDSYNFNQSYGKMSPVWTTEISLIGLNKRFLPIKSGSLESWSTPTASPSAAPEFTNSPSTTPAATATLAQATSTSPIISQNMIVAISAPPTTTNSEPAITPPENNIQPVANTSSTIVPAEKVLGSSDQAPNPLWKWIIVIVIFLAIIAGLIKLADRKNAKKS